MEKLFVDLGEKSYNINFSDSFSELARSLEEISAPKRLHIVTDTNVDALYTQDVKNMLGKAGYDITSYAFEAGEENKNMDSVLGICKSCLDNGLDRKCMILALGGGVVGDMAGFAAAIYLRGIDFVQIPTTLLSQSDSSVGGKTGVDFENGKNLLGAFHQPKLVYINVSTLKTLPEREFVSGMGEVIKHGIIREGGFFEYLEKNSEKMKALETGTMIAASKINCGIKARVVEEDERENGARADLNFGHTIGHAVESALDFKLTHGECVGLGMIAVSKIALNRKMITERDFERIKNILSTYGFQTSVKLPSDEKILKLMGKDKKKTDGKLKFVLPVKIGGVIRSSDICEKEIVLGLNEIRK